MPYYALQNDPVLPVELGTEKGVYVLHALDNDMAPLHINRVLDIDVKGVLYIGQTTYQNFKIRISFFKRVMKPDYSSKGHSGALNFKQIESLRNRFPINELYIHVYPDDNPIDLERDMLEEYRQKFGEVPPLNSSK